MPKRGKSEEFVYSEKQLQTLWNQCHELVDKVLVGLTAYMGLRVSEATHFNANWVREQEIHIPSSMSCNCWECSRRGNRWLPKSKAGIRVIPIPGFFKPILAEFLGYQSQGLQITRQAANYRIKQLIKKAKLPHGFPHSLRASAATLLAGKGLTAVELCYIMGWARLNMGEHYIRIATARVGARDKIKAIFG